MKLRIWLCVVILLLILTAPLFAQGDDSPPEPTLIEETVVTDVAEVEAPAAVPTEAVIAEAPPDDTDTVEVAVPPDDSETALDWLRLAFENDLHWYIFAILALFLAGNLIPPDEMQRRREQARQTETPADDVLYAILEGVQMLRGNANANPTDDAPLLAESASPFVVDSIDVHVDTHKPPDTTTAAG